MSREQAREAALWLALADPLRRRLLDLLRVGPATTGQLAKQFDVSRIAVMRHLAVLSNARLVLSRKRGRERWHYLNALPLERLPRRWVGPIEAGWARRLLNLDTNVGLRRTTSMDVAESGLAIDIAQEITFTRPRPVVFAGLGDVSAWWGPPYVSSAATDLRLALRLGGPFEEIWGKAGGRLLAIVSAVDQDRTLELTGPFHFGLVFGVAQFHLEDAGMGTLLRFSHRGIGSIDAETAASFAEGWSQLLSKRLVAFVEKGVRLGMAARAR